MALRRCGKVGTSYSEHFSKHLLQRLLRFTSILTRVLSTYASNISLNERMFKGRCSVLLSATVCLRLLIVLSSEAMSLKQNLKSIIDYVLFNLYNKICKSLCLFCPLDTLAPTNECLVDFPYISLVNDKSEHNGRSSVQVRMNLRVRCMPKFRQTTLVNGAAVADGHIKMTMMFSSRLR